MELKQKYIRDSGYDLEDDFTDTLLEVNPLLALLCLMVSLFLLLLK